MSRTLSSSAENQLAHDIQSNVDSALKNPTDKTALSALQKEAGELKGNFAMIQAVQTDLNKMETASSHLPQVTLSLWGADGDIQGTSQIKGEQATVTASAGGPSSVQYELPARN